MIAEIWVRLCGGIAGWGFGWGRVCLFLGVCGVVVAFSRPVLGQDTPGDQKTPQEVTGGEIAPFSGLLLDYRTAAKLTAKAERCDAQLEIERSTAAEHFAAAERYAAELRAADQAFAAARIRALEVAAADAAPGWYQAPALWFGVGIVTAGAIVAVTGYALQASR